MSAVTDCNCACPTPEVTAIPGTEGAAGEATNGTDGVNAYTLTTGASSPATFNKGDTGITVNVVNASWVAIGQNIAISGAGLDDNAGYFLVTAKTATALTLTYLDTGANDDGQGVDSGVTVSPAGPGFFPGTAPTSITDNSGGSASDTIAAGAGQFTHSVYFPAPAITGNVLLYTYTPGFAFKILKISASIVSAITTGGKAATLTTAINGTPTTGGVVVMSGAYALGSQQASSAAITGFNTGNNAQAITVTASSVTAFAEGGFMLHFEIQNTDSSDAIASMSDHINDLITAITP